MSFQVSRALNNVCNCCLDACFQFIVLLCHMVAPLITDASCMVCSRWNQISTIGRRLPVYGQQSTAHRCHNLVGHREECQ